MSFRRFAILAFLSALSTAAVAAPPPSACLSCHQDASAVDEKRHRPATEFLAGVHASVGISCEQCHGGNPDPALAKEKTLSMNPAFKANPFRGKPARKDIPALCGGCHSDPDYMKKFRPDSRTDQLKEYATSHHGRALARGNESVATCIDCHGAHEIRRPTDAASKVHPAKVAATCASCHADPLHMKDAKTADGRPLPIDQLERWKRSVHGQAMIVRGDLFAPTCNDCHGNHGASPPGVDSVANVCGQCHGREADLFRASPKHAGLQEHNGYLADAGEEGCASCHSSPDLPATIQGIRQFQECVTCHGNHSVIRPTVAMLGPLPEVPCALCHEDPAKSKAAEADRPETWKNYTTTRDQLLAKAAESKLTGDDRFDWMVDRALELPNHTIELESESGAPARKLRPEFERLFVKLRIGKTHHTFLDPQTGREVAEKIRRCTDCHGPEPQTGADPLGHQTSVELLGGMQRVMVTLGRADRAILAAKRGGVEMRKPQLALDKAVDAAIGLEALVHGFRADTDSAFVKQRDTGLVAAKEAWDGGQAGLLELGGRRKGLWVSLALIVLALVALAWKIRSLGD